MTVDESYANDHAGRGDETRDEQPRKPGPDGQTAADCPPAEDLRVVRLEPSAGVFDTDDEGFGGAGDDLVSQVLHLPAAIQRARHERALMEEYQKRQLLASTHETFRCELEIQVQRESCEPEVKERVRTNATRVLNEMQQQRGADMMGSINTLAARGAAALDEGEKITRRREALARLVQNAHMEILDESVNAILENRLAVKHGLIDPSDRSRR